MEYIKDKIEKIVSEYVKREFGKEYPVRFLNPPKISMGDLTLSSAFEIGKRERKNPKEIAEKLKALLIEIDEIEKIEIAGPGYINLFLNKEKYFNNIKNVIDYKKSGKKTGKTIVEHTNINPNKAAHIGHMRNAVLGDTLVRMLKFTGEEVEVQNYIDDTGVQVADVVYGALYIDNKSIDDLRKIEKIDYYLWDLYVKVYENDSEESKSKRREVHHKIEKGESPEREYAEFISLAVLKRHLETVERLGIYYDVLPRESDIIALKFWDSAFELMKESGVIYFQDEGENRGCWVMKVFEDGEEREKVIVKSNGAITYVGKDISYHLWKFGLLKKDFYYKKFDKRHYITTSKSEEAEEGISFGSGKRVFNVIDQRQSYLQNIVKKAISKMGYEEAAENLTHFSYEVVALSKKSAEEMGFKVEEGKSFVEVSGRKGVGVKADDLIDELERRALSEVRKRHPEFSSEKSESIARMISSSALRYYMLKYTLNSLIVFDFDEALKFEGETGPYLQYSNVRMKSLFRKFEEETGIKVEDEIKPPYFFESFESDKLESLWEAIVIASRFDSELDASIKNLEPSRLAKFAFLLCQKLNYIYNNFPVIKEKDREKRKITLFTLHFLYKQLNKTLDILGIEKPEAM